MSFVWRSRKLSCPRLVLTSLARRENCFRKFVRFYDTRLVRTLSAAVLVDFSTCRLLQFRVPLARVLCSGDMVTLFNLNVF
jgi:hypothetical protein